MDFQDPLFDLERMDIRELEKLVVTLRTCSCNLPSILDGLAQIQTSDLPNRRNRLLSAKDHPMIPVVQHISRIILINDLEEIPNMHFVKMVRDAGYEVNHNEKTHGSIRTKKGIIAYGY